MSGRASGSVRGLCSARRTCVVERVNKCRMEVDMLKKKGERRLLDAQVELATRVGSIAACLVWGNSNSFPVKFFNLTFSFI